MVTSLLALTEHDCKPSAVSGQTDRQTDRRRDRQPCLTVKVRHISKLAYSMSEIQEENFPLKQLQRDAEHQQQKTLLPHLHRSLARHFDTHSCGLQLPLAASKEGAVL